MLETVEENETLKDFVRKGFLLDSELLSFFSKLRDLKLSEEVLNRIVVLSKSRVITKETLLKYLPEISPIFLRQKEKKEVFESFFGLSDIKKPEVRSLEPAMPKREEVKILSSGIIPYKR